VRARDAGNLSQGHAVGRTSRKVGGPRTIFSGRRGVDWVAGLLGGLLGGVLASFFGAVLAPEIRAESPSAQASPRSVLLATTTSIRDSGLLDVLLPIFSAQTGIRVQAVAVGTGAALRMGAEGNADLLLTHAPEAENALVASQAVSRRVEIMQNYFVIAGPPEDPAGVAASASAVEALARIHARELPFVSRGDDSGTHKREAALFRDAGVDPDARWPGLTRTGSGMGISLQVAGQRKAYILSDIGTFLAFRERAGLVALSHPEPDLLNVYSVLLVNPLRFPRVRAKEAGALAAFFQSEIAREAMREFGSAQFGRPLFRPLAAQLSSP
jgi:tungstate transport system substrate-binding protein